jgi:hypothetical protein
VADVQYNRPVECGRYVRARAVAVGRAKFLNPGSFRLGDALERYGESRRLVQRVRPPRVVGGGGTGMEPL